MRWRRKTPANERKGRWGAHRIEAGLLVGGWEFESWAKRTTSSEPLCPATRQSGMRFRPATNIFIFTPQFRPFARCFVRVFSSFLRQEPQRKREMHAFRCCRRQEHELACFSLLFPTRIPSYQLTSSNIHSGCKVSPKTPSKNSARPYRENEQTASCITDSSNQSKTQRGISISAVHTPLFILCFPMEFLVGFWPNDSFTGFQLPRIERKAISLSLGNSGRSTRFLFELIFPVVISCKRTCTMHSWKEDWQKNIEIRKIASFIGRHNW